MSSRDFFTRLPYRNSSSTEHKSTLTLNILDLPNILSEPGDTGNMAFFNDQVYIRKSVGWGPLISLSSIGSGNGITITQTGNGLSVNLSRLLLESGSGAGLVNNGDPSLGDYKIKTLSGEDGINVSSNANTVSIRLNRAINSLGSGVALVNNGTPSAGDYSLKSLVASNGVGLVSNTDTITLSLDRSINSLGTGTSLLLNGNAAAGDYSLKSLVTANGVALASNATTVRISNDLKIVDASNVFVPNSTSLYSQPLPSADYSLKRLAVGSGMSLSDVDGVITLDSSNLQIYSGVANLFAIQFPSSTTVVPVAVSQVGYVLRKVGRTVHVDINANQWRFSDPNVGKYVMNFTMTGVPLTFMPDYASAIVVETGLGSTSAGLISKGRFGITGSIHISNDNPFTSYLDSILFSAPLSFSPTNTIDVFIGAGTLFNNTGPRVGGWDGYFNTPGNLMWFSQP